MNIINQEKYQDDLDFEEVDVKIKRGSFKGVIKVCPHCFYPLRNIEHFLSMNIKYICTNDDCGWKGALAIEVLVEDYKKEFKGRLKE